MKRILFLFFALIGSLYCAHRPTLKLTPLVTVSGLIAAGVYHSSIYEENLPKSAIQTAITGVKNPEYAQAALFHTLASSQGSLHKAILTYSEALEVPTPGNKDIIQRSYNLAFSRCVQQFLVINIDHLRAAACQDNEQAYEAYKQILEHNIRQAHDCAQEDARYYIPLLLATKK